ncbi:MAG: hypothetical protein J6I53_06840 [Treponema sp.]|nr:hypothetical protein [Treponema sp.]
MSKPNKNNKTKNSVLKYLDSLEESTFDDATDLITISFKYFCVNQPAGQVFADWKDSMRLDLLQKLAEYTKYSRQHWRNEFSNGLPLLAEYGSFPLNSDFSIPANIPTPDELIWSRFRLMQKVRVCGFFVSTDIAKKYSLSVNTFYVVFLDKDHRFYKTEKE